MTQKKSKNLFVKSGKTKESGRSMLEMLAVLAILSTVTFGGMMSYSFLMEKYKAQESAELVSNVVGQVQTAGLARKYAKGAVIPGKGIVQGVESSPNPVGSLKLPDADGSYVVVKTIANNDFIVEVQVAKESCEEVAEAMFNQGMRVVQNGVATRYTTRDDFIKASCETDAGGLRTYAALAGFTEKEAYLHGEEVNYDCPNAKEKKDINGVCCDAQTMYDGKYCTCPTGLVASGTTCVECTENAHCSRNEVCDKTENKCVECTEDADCNGNQNCIDQRCGGCHTNYNPNTPNNKNMCSADKPVCQDGTCVACPAGYDYIDTTRRCEQSDGSCNGNYGSGATRACPATNPVCVSGVCEACSEGYEYKEGICTPKTYELVCEEGYTLQEGVCVKTAEGDECPEGYTLEGDKCVKRIACEAGWTLNENNQCVPPDTSCTASYQMGTETDRECPASSPICNAGQCFPCNGVYKNGSCGECEPGSGMVKNAEGECVTCYNSARGVVNCDNVNRFCDTRENPKGVCVQCLSDEDCGFPDAVGAYCEKGKCNQCAADKPYWNGSACHKCKNDQDGNMADGGCPAGVPYCGTNDVNGFADECYACQNTATDANQDTGCNSLYPMCGTNDANGFANACYKCQNDKDGKGVDIGCSDDAPFCGGYDSANGAADNTFSQTCGGCPANQVFQAGTGCVCPEGSNWNGSTCITCASDEKWNDTDKRCDCVYSGATNNNDTTACYCPTGYAPHAATLSCVCAKGYTMNNGSCVPCSAGYYKNTIGNGACTPCEAGTYQPNRGATSCKACSANAVSGKGSTSCTDCECGRANASTCVEKVRRKSCTSDAWRPVNGTPHSDDRSCDVGSHNGCSWIDARYDCTKCTEQYRLGSDGRWASKATGCYCNCSWENVCP